VKEMEEEFKKADTRIHNQEECLKLTMTKHSNPEIEEYRLFIVTTAVNEYFTNLTDAQIEELIKDLS